MNLATGPITSKPTLITRCKSGDNSAYQELYSRYSKAMLNISLRILTDKAEAEDVLQESFLKAFQNIKNFENEVAFGSWLKRVVVNRSIDLIRKQNRNLVPLGEKDYADAPEEENDDDLTYDIDTVKTAMSRLPDGYRLVLTLFLFEDYGHKEIAAMLGISEGTSKSQYNRAKKKIIQLIRQSS